MTLENGQETEKLRQSAEGLCQAIGYEFTPTPEIGKFTLLNDTTVDEAPGDLGPAIYPTYTLAKIIKIDPDGTVSEFTTPFGLVNLTTQEMEERIEVAVNALYLRDHPEER